MKPANKTATAGADAGLRAAAAATVAALEAEFASNPPTICLIGLSGVGKSSTINAMFGANRPVSATTRGTSRFNASTIDIVSERMVGASVKCTLRVIDAPGLGEDVELDDNYLKRYKSHLPKCDIALWVVAARNRALALDQQYLAALSDHLPSLVLGINQVDLVDPLDWNERINMPSANQAAAIKVITADRHAKLARYIAADCPVVPYSAHRYYNLQSLFATCLRAAPERRRWMFELLKSFSTHDWLNRAKGLSEAQKADLAKAHIKSDAKIQLIQP
jgi:uncharacterized protein